MEWLKWMAAAGIGGFAGSALRFLCGRLFQGIASAALLPWSTLTVNLVGAFLIGIFYGMGERHLLSPTMSALLITGLCGGLTTFSSLAHELLIQLEGRHFGALALYLALTLLLGVALVALGRSWVRSWS